MSDELDAFVAGAAWAAPGVRSEEEAVDAARTWVGPSLDAAEHETPATVDYELLNHQARLLHDAALDVGRIRGDREGSSRVSEDRLRSGLDLVIMMLHDSVNARDMFDQRRTPERRGDDWPERVLALRARMLLGRVPSTPDVMRAIEGLRRAGLNNMPGQSVDRRIVDRVIVDLTRYLEHLGGYR